jgi:hypothetical protein
MTINEARRKIDLGSKTGGDEILVQQQDIPLSLAGKAQQSALTPPSTSSGNQDGQSGQDGQDGGDPTGDAAASKQALHIFRAYARDAA